ncbi:MULTISPECIES: Crp/Fnr family transcriptional regulator [unclassified Crossiella]|uniref:Crp/Fnr family transcriptional regulator n=1 Tax=unclassified Crossiella TaxID=2620835 RepID=UPI001FFE5A1A|nr:MULTISPECIES: Crp/Fnr family transcriptional regulator [unclassified Crossiella]MCK2242842.1 Crp/Fnr family transcriptional regulator [Crossiella sp. S99.2]MCK2256719.1 Crp/Fnr family transcriptional regulator [Crossiella sp. S99.1]
MRSAGTRRRFSPGAVIWSQGEPSQHVFVVLEGRIRVSTGSVAGREAVLAICGPGEIVGELSAVDGRTRSANVAAVDQVEVLVVPAARLDRLCEEHPRVAWAMLRVVADRLRQSDRRRSEYVDGSVAHRTVALLLDLAEQYGRPVAAGVEIALSISQQQLADTMSVSRESLARVLRELRDRRLVDTGRQRITVLDLPGLRALGAESA